VKHQDNILEVISEEEKAFSSMLDRGIKFFGELESELKEQGKKEVTGDKAFFLYDTLGFPIDLTELMAEEAGLKVDSDGFVHEMEAQKQRSREARNAAKSGGAPRLELIAEQTAWLADNGIPPTDDSSKYKSDVELTGTILALFGADGFLTDGVAAENGACVGLVLDRSSFYAEAGGQEADMGAIEILSEDGETVGSFTVTDVQSYGGFILHSGIVAEGRLEVGSVVKCKVDNDQRRLVTPNHSMTHVLNSALRDVLGDTVDQRGSLCNDEKLRFDFSHKKAMTTKELRATEEICQKVVSESQPVTSTVMPLEEAQAIDGVRAVFGEVYPDPVRVVTIGEKTSIEFCGGTHLGNTGEAEAFVIVEETAVAKGIRRITAVTKGTAKRAIQEGITFEATVTEMEQLPADTPDLDKKAGATRKEVDETFMSAPLKAELRARIEAIQKKGIEANKAALAGRVDRCLNDVKAQLQDALAKDTRAMVLNVDIGADSKASQKVMKAVQSIAPDMAFMGLSEEEVGSGGRLLAFAVVPGSLTEAGFKADEWIRSTLEACGGRGGGTPSSAQGQAKECKNVDQVLVAANSFAENKVEATTL
jgi:alanyl-tRNA synthetase